MTRQHQDRFNEHTMTFVPISLPHPSNPSRVLENLRKNKLVETNTLRRTNTHDGTFQLSVGEKLHQNLRETPLNL